MVIFKSAAALNAYILQQKQTGKKIGFVPTMGALHPGHLSLVRESKDNTGLTVCSIFVNPTQFNNAEDFKHYPITIERDIEQLLTASCDVLFFPPVIEIYPPEHRKKTYNLGAIEQVLEGAHRPGHFQGVCEVVDRLLEITAPDDLYMGQKDYQQCMVISKLLTLLNKNEAIALHVQPTLREADDLAMSSRNLRLTTTERQLAVTISKTLSAIKKNYHQLPNAELIEQATQRLQVAGFKTDYVAICDRETLQPKTDSMGSAVALIGATLGSIRLIDNMLLD